MNITQALAAQPDHWLIKHAKNDNLGNAITPLSSTLINMFVGAVGYSCEHGGNMAEITRLYKALEAALEIVEKRRTAESERHDAGITGIVVKDIPTDDQLASDPHLVAAAILEAQSKL